ncbi:MAG: amino acid adenylation domain-containing protein [Desulfuromonadales bacterium]|nr:amino acid adenylation domain-containing protein [Desulfuromonadales bacterium]
MTRLSVQHEMDLWAIRTPEKAAVHDGKEVLTYADLATSSNRVGQALHSLGVSAQERVVFCLSRSVHCLTALLGILRAGAVYVPIDPKSPPDRAKGILHDCAPRAFICDATTRPLARRLAGGDIPIVCLGEATENTGEFEFDQAWVDRYPAVSPAQEVADDDLAYILYTSGSTGQPKGVMIHHRNIRSYIDWAVHSFDIAASDRILCTAPFHFDMSTFDIFTTLRSGATLFIAAEALTLFPEKLVTFMEQQQITLWKGISSLLMYLARAGVLRPGRLPALRRVLYGGEALSTRWLMQWMENFPEKAFFNVYGPTEATGISLFHRIEQMPKSPQELIPIGHPCTDTYVYLLNDDLAPVPDGEIGELFIGGAGLARGYLNSPKKTAQAFLSDPFRPGGRIYRSGDLARQRTDGTYEFVGRADHQVKIMGYRIELGEIEHALSALPGVHDVAVAVVSTGDLDLRELVAFIEGELNDDTTAAFEQLKQQLPVYMIPRRLCNIARLPRCERGKIDRKALQAMEFK